MNWVACLAAGCRGAGREDDIRLETDKLLCEDCMTILLALSPLIPDDEILSLHVAELTEALQKGVDEVGSREGEALPRYPIVTVPSACCVVAANGTVKKLRVRVMTIPTVLCHIMVLSSSPPYAFAGCCAVMPA